MSATAGPRPRRSRVRIPALALLALVLLAPPGRTEDLAAAEAALEVQRAQALDELATWCIKKRLYGKRDETYELLLAYEPDHAQARRFLRYARDESGAWVQDPRYKRGTNWDRAAVAVYEERLGALNEAHDAALIALCETASDLPALLWARRRLLAYAHRAPQDPRPGPLLRRLTLALWRFAREQGLVTEMGEAATWLRDLYPEDVEVRTSLGEVKHDGRWMLRESARMLARTTGLDAAALRAKEDAGTVGPAAPTKVEAGIDLPWQQGATLADVRVMGTVEPEALAAMARHVQAAGPLFAHAFGTPPLRRKGLTIYVFAEKGQLETFLAKFPVVDNFSLQQREALGLDLVFPDGNSMAVKANPADAQLDLVVNTVLNQLFSDTLLDGNSTQGWHAEGLSRYLAFHLAGTRLSINLADRYGTGAKDREVPGSGDAWLSQAHGLLSRTSPVGLALMLGKGLDAFESRDAIVSYAFAVYLLEGHDGLAALFVRTLASSADVDKACREILGAPLAVVEQRFRTWLDEVTTQKGVPK